jgi:hypothetical protein
MPEVDTELGVMNDRNKILRLKNIIARLKLNLCFFLDEKNQKSRLRDCC